MPGAGEVDPPGMRGTPTPPWTLTCKKINLVSKRKAFGSDVTPQEWGKSTLPSTTPIMGPHPALDGWWRSPARCHTPAPPLGPSATAQPPPPYTDHKHTFTGRHTLAWKNIIQQYHRLPTRFLPKKIQKYKSLENKKPCIFTDQPPKNTLCPELQQCVKNVRVLFKIESELLAPCICVKTTHEISNRRRKKR